MKSFFICSSNEFAADCFSGGSQGEAGPGLMPFFLTALFAGLDAAALKRDAADERQNNWSDGVMGYKEEFSSSARRAFHPSRPCGMQLNDVCRGHRGSEEWLP